MKKLFILLNILFLSTGLLYSSEQPGTPPAKTPHKGPPGSQVAGKKPAPKVATHRKDRKEEAPPTTTANHGDESDFEELPTGAELERQAAAEEAAEKARKLAVQEVTKDAPTLVEAQRATSYKQATAGSQPTPTALLRIILKPAPQQQVDTPAPKRDDFKARGFGILTSGTESWRTDEAYVDAVIAQKAAPDALKAKNGEFPTALTKEAMRQADIVATVCTASVKAQKDADVAHDSLLTDPLTRLHQLLSMAQLPEASGHISKATSAALEADLLAAQRRLEVEAQEQATAMLTRVNTLKGLRAQLPNRERDVSPDRTLTAKRK